MVFHCFSSVRIPQFGVRKFYGRHVTYKNHCSQAKYNPIYVAVIRACDLHTLNLDHNPVVSHCTHVMLRNHTHVLPSNQNHSCFAVTTWSHMNKWCKITGTRRSYRRCHQFQCIEIQPPNLSKGKKTFTLFSGHSDFQESCPKKNDPTYWLQASGPTCRQK